MSSTKEWAILSSKVYKPKFINELSDLLKKYNVHDILECGCGDGYVLYGLAKKGFNGIGIDGNHEMISLASKNNHPNISYREMNWLEIGRIPGLFDAVICRGNSLSYVVSWNEKNINPKKAKEKIRESLGLFFQKLKPKGLLYIDTIIQAEVDRNGGEVEIKEKNICWRSKVEYDWQNKTRQVHVGGSVGNKTLKGNYISYLLPSAELENIVRGFKPSLVWQPKLANEIDYDIICAIK
jgi:SAM-dependent methyltransferase